MALALDVCSTAAAEGPIGAEPWTNRTTEVRPEIGPSFPGMTPGVDGYKVFGPGAIKQVPVLATGQNTLVEVDQLTEEVRSGYSDAWKRWNGPFSYWEHWGSHSEDSTLYETDISIGGFLRNIAFAPNWRASCRDPQLGTMSGSRASCQTTFNDQCRNIYAESTHHFHTNGYVDSNFTSGDTETAIVCSN